MTRAFRIAWRHKYLWLLALLGGADTGGNSLGGNYSNLGNVGNGQQSSAQIGQFLQSNVGMIELLVLVALVIFLLFFLLSCVTTGALVRASAEHDAERPFGLGPAWRAGLETFWPLLGLRLLVLLWTILVLAVIGVFVVLGIASVAAGQNGTLAMVIAVGILVALVLIATSVVVGIVAILATRAIVLERRGTFAGLGRGMRLIRERLGRVLVTWLLQAALSVGVGFAIAVALILVIVVLAGIVVAAAVTGGARSALVVGIPVGLAALAIVLFVSAVTGTYFSTFWTLAYRRMEVEAPPPVAWPPPQPQYPGYPPPAG